jgi:hypothetical protein
MLIYLDVDTWKYQFIIEDLPMQNGNWFRKDYKLDYIAGKENYYP